MKKETIKTIIIILFIVIVAITLTIYFSYNQGKKQGGQEVYREIITSLQLHGYYDVFVFDGNSSRIIKLIPYVPTQTNG